MRGKRSKAYKKLMGQYQQTFGFREPYQVLIDMAMIKEAARCVMDLPEALERTLRGKAKPMITHCTLRHLFSLDPADTPNKESLIAAAKSFELRKCNHHTLSSPLPELECFESVIIKNGENKHRYCIAFQTRESKDAIRRIPGVPSIVIIKSVMILEAMTEESKVKREVVERGKFLKGVVDARRAKFGEANGGVTGKRKRDEEGDEEMEDADGEGEREEGEGKEGVEKKKKKKKGPKGPNPLAVKKPKKTGPKQQPSAGKPKEGGETDGAQKKRRKRKHKPASAAGGAGGEGAGAAPKASAAEA